MKASRILLAQKNFVKKEGDLSANLCVLCVRKRYHDTEHKLSSTQRFAKSSDLRGMIVSMLCVDPQPVFRCIAPLSVCSLRVANRRQTSSRVTCIVDSRAQRKASSAGAMSRSLYLSFVAN